jgi:hypothetical protein
VDPRAGLEDAEKRKFLTLPGLELRPLGRPAYSQSLYRLSYSDSPQICVYVYIYMLVSVCPHKTVKRNVSVYTLFTLPCSLHKEISQSAVCNWKHEQLFLRHELRSALKQQCRLASWHRVHQSRHNPAVELFQKPISSPFLLNTRGTAAVLVCQFALAF